MVAVGGPAEERAHVLGHLAGGRGGPVPVLDHVVVQRSSHADRTTSEIWVVVLRLGNLAAGRGIEIACA